MLDGANVLPRHLNKHIDYDVVPTPASDKAKSLATPTAMAVTADGQTLYVAALGSSKVGVFSTAQLEADTFVPTAGEPDRGERRRADRPRARRGARPALRPHALRQRDQRDRHVRRRRRSRTCRCSIPSRRACRTGGRSSTTRSLTSSHGESSCASCHIFGDFDSLAWDLGNPDDAVAEQPEPDPAPRRQRPGLPPAEGSDDHAEPARHGEPRPDALARRSHGRQRSVGGDPLAGGPGVQEVQHRLRRAARPRRPRSPTPTCSVHRLHPAGDVSAEPDPPARQPAHGRGAHRARPSSTDPSPTPSSTATGATCSTRRTAHFGTDGFTTFEAETQMFKIPHLRNLYQKVGMFGMPAVSGLRAGEQRQPGRAGARLRLPARRQRGHDLPLPPGERVQQHGRGRAEPRAVHAPVRLQPGADRRPADHADQRERRRRGRRASIS